MLILLILSLIIGGLVGHFTGFGILGIIVGGWVFITVLPGALEMSIRSGEVDRIIHSNNVNSRRIERAIRDSEMNNGTTNILDNRHYNDNRQLHINGKSKVGSQYGSTKTVGKKKIT